MSQIASNPLSEVHHQAEAEFQNYGPVEIVCTFGEPQAEYSAIRKGCAMLDWPHRGILRVSGKDRLDFLNRFLTNSLIDKESKTPMAAGSGVYAFLLNNKGRIVADMNVLERGDATLLESDERNIAGLMAQLEKFVFSEDVKFESLIGRWHEIGLMGPRAAEVIAEISPGFAELERLESSGIRIFDTEATVWRDDPAGVPGYFMAIPVEQVKKIWMSILSRFSTTEPGASQSAKRQVWPAGWAAFNATRIEAGRPMFGIDFDDSVLPAETGQLDRAVSFTKGCYLGQEIVARMHARGQVARQIVGIRMEDGSLPIAGAPVMDEAQNQVGGITSSTMSPVLSNTAICLAIVKKPFMAVGTSLMTPAEGAIRKCTVASLPFFANEGAGK